MAIRLISASWAQKHLNPTFLTWCTSSSWKILFLPIPASSWLLDSFRPPERKNVWILPSRHDVRRVHEKFSSRHCSKFMAVGLILASIAQRRLNPTLWTRCTSSSWKIFFSPIRASSWLLDSFRPHEPENVWILLYRYDARRVHEKFSSRRFEQAHGC